MGWKHYKTGDPPPQKKKKKREPQVGRGTVWYPSSNSSLQIFIFEIHQIFNISYFPHFNLKYLFPKIPQNHPKIYTKPPNSG